jgi:hypothetical protein
MAEEVISLIDALLITLHKNRTINSSNSLLAGDNVFLILPSNSMYCSDCTFSISIEKKVIELE